MRDQLRPLGPPQNQDQFSGRENTYVNPAAPTVAAALEELRKVTDSLVEDAAILAVAFVGPKPVSEDVKSRKAAETISERIVETTDRLLAIGRLLTAARNALGSPRT